MTLSDVRTIIVEDGDLYIDGDIENSQDSSYAFIVKRGDIIIDPAVSRIAGVYLALSGQIRAPGDTSNRLIVDGSLFGESAPLVESRTYIRGETSYEALSVGVVVDYSTRAIRRPPPLLAEFLREFSVDRVAR